MFLLGVLLQIGMEDLPINAITSNHEDYRKVKTKLHQIKRSALVFEPMASIHGLEA